MKTGSGSARIDYDADTGYALFPMSRTLPSGSRYIGLSMSATADALTFALMFDTGEEVLYSTGGPDWEQVLLRIPDGATALTGLRLYDMTQAAHSGSTSSWRMRRRSMTPPLPP